MKGFVSTKVKEYLVSVGGILKPGLCNKLLAGQSLQYQLVKLLIGTLFPVPITG
jgi:hypothetical protein